MTDDRMTPDDLIARLVTSCAEDERIAAVFLGGSLARGESDEYSDIDLCVITYDDSYADVLSERPAFVRKLGTPLFLENFGNDNMAFVILADGAEVELNFFRTRDLDSIRSGPHRVLLDKDGILAGVTFPGTEPDEATRVEALRQILFWFWHDLGHFTTAIGRGQLWWAAGQLEQLRSYYVNLIRIHQGGESQSEPYWKLDHEIETEPLDPLRSTFVAMERGEMLRAAREILAAFREQAPVVAEANGLAYPADLDRLIGGHLDAVR